MAESRPIPTASTRSANGRSSDGNRGRRLTLRAYIVRLTLFTYNGALWPLVIDVPGDAVFWTLWLTLHFAWPHVALALSWRARDTLATERYFAAAEAVVVGCTINELGYLAWYVFAAAAATLTAALGLAGQRQLLRNVLSMLLGTLAWGALRGFELTTHPPPVAEVVGAVGGMVPLLMVMRMTYDVMQGLARARRSIEHKTQLFQSLAQAGVTIRAGRDIDGILAGAVDELADMMPGLGFGVVLQAPYRPQLVQYQCFRRIPAGDAESLLAELRQLAPGAELDDPAVLVIGGQTYHVLPMGGRLTEQRGCLIVRGQLTEPDSYNAVTLFLDQLAATLESALLTARLQRLADTDPLSGLYSRGYFDQAFDRLQNAWQAGSEPALSLIAVDINGLKPINDALGHEAGDRVIRAAAERLRATTRDADVLARTGGDEFAILARSCDAAQARVLTDRIHEAFAGQDLTLVADGVERTVPLSVSVGAASTDELAPEALPKAADRRMYAAKASHYRGSTCQS